MEAKQIKVIIPGAEEEKHLDVVVMPGETVRNIKEQVPQIREMSLFRSHNSLPCKESVDLYPSLQDRDRLFAASYQDVGQRLFSRMFGNPPPSLETANSQPTGSHRHYKALWERQGWKRKGSEYYGLFRCRNYRFRGKISMSGDTFEVFIWSPPPELRRHRHWGCFNHHGEDMYKIHFTNPLTNVNDAILNTQRLLSEAVIFCRR
jgi:hypothetical protein